MNIDLKKLREAAERLIEQGSGDWTALTNYWDIANPQTIIELCDMIEKMKCCDNCKYRYGHENDCALDHEGKNCTWELA
jgi:hypothetical protein